ncbi:unnamed protein product, partial [marine sediment metagenome]
MEDFIGVKQVYCFRNIGSDPWNCEIRTQSSRKSVGECN